MQTDILVLPRFDLNDNQNNQEGQTGTGPVVTEEETHENQVLLPENQDVVQTQEHTNNQTNAGLRRSERPKKHDILLACTNMSMLHDCKAFLAKHFNMTNLGEASYVLGIEISRNRKRGSDVPISKGDKFSIDQGKREMADKPYASLVGSLMYAKVCTRPDISFSVSILRRFQSNPGQAHWIAGKTVMRYLQRTKDYKLVYKRSDKLEVEGYADADFAGCKDDLKSTSGYVFLFAGAATSWRSNKQPLTVASTMLAEFLACYEATTQAMWLKNFITSLGVVESIQLPIQLWNDNSTTVLFAKGNKRTKASRILEVKFFDVKEKNRDGHILRWSTLAQMKYNGCRSTY
ncbi:unnamed protein product [Prunus armeniaca]